MSRTTTDRDRSYPPSVPKRIREAARTTDEGLRKHPELQAIAIDCDEETLRLVGVVRSFYQKQLAQTIALRAANGDRVVNDVQVRNGR